MSDLPSKDLTKQIIASGEAYVDAQLLLATSADQRASSMAGVFAAAGTAVVAGLFALLNSQIGAFFWPLVIGGGITALLFLAASALCGFAVHPVGFYLPGTQPKNWDARIKNKTPDDEILFGLTKNIQEKIENNRNTISTNAKRFKWGLRSGIFAPWVGLIVLALLVLGQFFCHVPV